MDYECSNVLLFVFLQVYEKVALMISKGKYGIDFIDKPPIPYEDSVEIETLCGGFLKLQTLGKNAT